MVHIRFADHSPESFADLLVASLREFWRNEEDGGLVDLVIVTGDLAERGERDEFQQAFRFFAAVAQELQVPNHHFVFVPGNHDVSWPNCEKVFAEQVVYKFDDAELRKRLNEVKLQFFYEGLQDFLDIEKCQKWLDHCPMEDGSMIFHNCAWRSPRLIFAKKNHTYLRITVANWVRSRPKP